MKRAGYVGQFLITLCFLVLLAATGVGEATAATYYVSPSGSDSNSGSPTAPFKTVQKAANIVNPGDTVIVADGTYTDTNGDGRIISLTRSGTSANWITFKSATKWGAVLDGQNNKTAYGVVFSSAASYISIEDFEIKDCKTDGVFSNSASNDIYIYGNKIHDIGRYTTYMSTGAGNCIYQGTGAGYHTYDSNLIYNCGRLNPDTTPSADESTCICPYNTACSTTYTCTTPGGCNMCYNHDHGLYAFGHDTTFINNIVYGIQSGWAMQLAGGASPGGPNWTIANNTFYGANTQRDGHILFWDSGVAATNILVENNISDSPRNYFLNSSLTGTSTWTITNNLVYGASVENIAGGTVSGNITGQDPKFVDLTNKNFHLQSASPAIDKGIQNGLAYDADNNMRTGAPDLGAYEYGASSASTAPTPMPTPSMGSPISPATSGLVWDDVNKRMGIGTLYPEATLDIVEQNGANPNRGLVSSQHDDNPYAATIQIKKSRGTEASPTALLNGDAIGALHFWGYDGNNYQAVSSIRSMVNGPVQPGYVPGELWFHTGSDSTSTWASPKMIITTAGNVGIGTTAPSQRLEVNGGTMLNTPAAKPACTSATRGTFWFTQDDVNGDTAEVCAQVGSSYAWRRLF